MSLSEAETLVAEGMARSEGVPSEASAGDDVQMLNEDEDKQEEEKMGEEVEEKKGEGEEKKGEEVQGEDMGQGSKEVSEEKEVTLKDLFWTMKQSEAWQRQCSKHLSHIERRTMESEFLGHEVVRMFLELIMSFSPSPCGDWGWLLRKSHDIMVRAQRQLMTLYNEDSVNCMKLVRLYFEEAFARALMSYDEGEQKKAICSMVLTMHNLEDNTMRLAIIPPEMRLLSTLTEANIMKIGKLVRSQTCNVMRMPSFPEVMELQGMRHEVFSLLPFEGQSERIAMTKVEVKTLIEATGGELKPEQKVEGLVGPGLFANIFD